MRLNIHGLVDNAKCYAASVGRKVANVPIATTLTLSKTDTIPSKQIANITSVVNAAKRLTT